MATYEKFALARFNSNGTLDTSFGDDGYVITDFEGATEATAKSIALDSYGRILLVGEAAVNGHTQIAMARYLDDGTLDASFGNEGLKYTSISTASDITGTGCAVDAKGAITVVGSGGPRHDHFLVVRFLENGTLNTAFNSEGSTPGTRYIEFTSGDNAEASSVAIDPDGNIVIAGHVYVDSQEMQFALARLYSGGKIDNSFSQDGKQITNFNTLEDERALDMIIDTQGRILLAGYGFGTEGGSRRFALARYHKDGRLDKTWSDDGKSAPDYEELQHNYGQAIAIDSQGRVIVAGYGGVQGSGSSHYNHFKFLLRRYESDGDYDSSFGSKGWVATDFEGADNAQGMDVAIDADDRVVVAGFAGSDVTRQYKFALARYNSDGTLDLSFGNNGLVLTSFPTSEPSSEEAYALAIDSRGRILVAGSTSILPAKKIWTVKGTISVKHQLSGLKEKFQQKSGTSGLPKLAVKVSARTKVGLIPGTWNRWARTETANDGTFSVSKAKSAAKRQFRIQVKFKNDELAVYDQPGELLEKLTNFNIVANITEDIAQQIVEQLTSFTYKAKWITIYKDSDWQPRGTVDLNLTFENGAPEELGNRIARAHADIWSLYLRVRQQFKSMGSQIAFQKPIKVVYPWDNPWPKLLWGGKLDKVEENYTNPYNNMIYIVETDYNYDNFSTGTLLHELMHLWAYQHSKNEKKLTTYFFTHNFVVHNKVKKTWVAAHEGFADYGEEMLQYLMFGKEQPLPYNREYLTFGFEHVGELTSIEHYSDLEYHCQGWRSLLALITMKKISETNFRMATQGNRQPQHEYVDYVGSPSGSCTDPDISFKQLLQVFLPNRSEYFPDEISTDDMSFTRFMARAEEIIEGLDETTARKYMELLDPQSIEQPADLFCK